MVRNRVRRVAGMERDDRGPLQRNPLDRSPRRRDHDGRNDGPRLGTNRSAATGRRITAVFLSLAKIGKIVESNLREASKVVSRDTRE